LTQDKRSKQMTTPRIDASLSRRTALLGLGAGGIGMALSARGRSSAAQDAASAAMANHPMVGVWMVTTPSGLAPGIFTPDGIAIIIVPATGNSPLGTTYVSTEIGTWEPISERGIHFTAVQLHSDANGNYVGSITIDGYPVVSADGQSLVDDSPDSGPTIRDAQGNVLDVLRGGPPVTGVRMGVGAPGFTEAATTGPPSS
jgi:hypothetical protein